jgi:hypothetical protein
MNREPQHNFQTTDVVVWGCKVNLDYKNKMRLFALLACAVLSLPCLSQTATEAPDPRALGTTEAILNYCAKEDPADADKYRAQEKLLAGSATQEELEKLRNSDEYRQAYDSVTDFTAKVDKHNAKRVCSESLNQGK